MKCAIIMILFFCIGCNTQNGYENYSSKKFPIEHTKAGFEKVPYGSVYAIQYKSEGVIRNNTQWIYNSFFVKMRITLVLTNGKEISNEELDPFPFLIPSYIHLIRGKFSAREENEFELRSPRITIDYKEYPIEKVIIMYYITAEDPINDRELNEVIYQIDVTNDWVNFISTFNEKVD